MRSITLHLESRAADVARWDRGEAPCEVVKRNNARTVWRVAAGEPALFVKRFPPSLVRDRARREARMLEALTRAGIPCPRLVAVARDRKGAYLVTEEIAGARVLRDVIGERGKVAALGRLTRRLQEAGFRHDDFHVGNVLARGDELFVLDVHRARRVQGITRGSRLETAAFVALSFRELVPQTQVLRYFRACGLDSRRDLLRAFEELRRAGERYFRGRQKRCMMDGTGFAVRGGIYHRRGVDPEALRKRVRSGEGEVIKKKARERLRRLPGGLFVKETRAAKALRIWENAHALDVRGIATPRLLACGRGWVVGEWVEAPDLYAFVDARYGPLGRAGRDDVLFRLARMIRRLHARGAFHHDLKGGNVLVSDRDFLLVDLDRVTFHREVSDGDRQFNLAQLNASVAAPVTRADRLRFLRYYLGRDRKRWMRRRAWVREIMRITVARKHRWP
jgi:tRNA A-37 threonylcarbamoyl transferase component Bud32